MSHHDDTAGHQHQPGHRFPTERWARLVSEERRALLNPDHFVDRLGVRVGSTVADLGAGPGFFTIPLAERVGPAGRVYAVDVSPEMIRVLRERGLPPQVHAAVSEENGFPIADGIVDVALLAFVLHELSNPAAFLADVKRILAPGGRFVVLEWIPKTEELGPPLHERLSVEASTRILSEGGFDVVEQGDANASNYFLVARVRSR